jgi:hypothetical protein
MGLPDWDNGGRCPPGGGGMGLPVGDNGGPPAAGRPGAFPAPPRDCGAAGPAPGVPAGPAGRLGGGVRGAGCVRGGSPERCAGGVFDCRGGRGEVGIGGRRCPVPGAGAEPASPGRLVTRRESLGRGVPRGGGGMGAPERDGWGLLGADRPADGSSGERGGVSDAGAGVRVDAAAGAGIAAGGVEVAGAGGVSGGGGGDASGAGAGDEAGGVSGSDGATGLEGAGTGSWAAMSPARPRRGAALTSAGSSGCLSRLRPSRSAFRRTRSACASSMLEEWLLTPMPRLKLRSSASLLVRPSSRASS